jgi:hypothetical protein
VNDVERRLAELGERARDVAGPLRARPEALRRIRRRRGLLSGAAALSVVAVVIGGIGLAGLPTAERDEPRPAHVATPAPDEPKECPIAFAPTYLPDGIDADPRPGSGGSPGVAAAEDAGIIGHFRGPQGTFIDVMDAAPPSATSRPSQITVLGAPATLAAIHEGYSVELRAGRCDYSLAGYGVTRGELRRFAEGLERVRHPAPVELRVVWPEDTAAEAYAACAANRGRQRTAPAIVSRFATDVLGWGSPIVDPPRTSSGAWTVTPLGGNVYDGGVEAGVRIWTEEVRPGCWSVSSVSRLPDRRQTGLGVSVRGPRVEVAFDPLGAASAEIRVGYGQRRVRRVWNAPANSFVRLVLGFRPDSTGSLLILLEDEDGDVFSAVATSLPAGDFAAG